jgi:23S rRNA pseudouridine2605 synthase
MSRERLQKILAAAGVASRRGAETLLRAGRVLVDGIPAKLGDSADPATSRITVDGKTLRIERHVYWIAHKPRGVITSTRDPEGRRTVLDLLPTGAPRVFPVGRLDFDTEGLVLLTNDGAVTHALLHPSLESDREYRVTVRGRVDDATLSRLAQGIVLEDGPTAPARIARVGHARGADETSFTLVLHEGRKRQIRRTMDALGHPVLRLVRVRMGPLLLGRLGAGKVRVLRVDEIATLQAHARATLRRGAVLTGRQAAGSGAAQPPEVGHEARKKPRPKSRRHVRND